MSRITRYVSLICLAAIGAVLALFVQDQSFSLPFAQAALTFGFIGVLTQVFSYRTISGSTASVSFIPFLASAAIAPHWVTVVVVAAACLAGQLAAKRDLIRTVFNTAQESFALALAILAYEALGGIPLHSIGESSSLSLFALFLVFFV
ncbi:MAG TPA: hypothetical protein VF887_02315, partial [Gemmatimonadaceae bacterium]